MHKNNINRYKSMSYRIHKYKFEWFSAVIHVLRKVIQVCILFHSSLYFLDTPYRPATQ